MNNQFSLYYRNMLEQKFLGLCGCFFRGSSPVITLEKDSYEFIRLHHLISNFHISISYKFFHVPFIKKKPYTRYWTDIFFFLCWYKPWQQMWQTDCWIFEFISLLFFKLDIHQMRGKFSNLINILIFINY